MLLGNESNKAEDEHRTSNVQLDTDELDVHLSKQPYEIIFK
jgi:hypothetical protein